MEVVKPEWLDGSSGDLGNGEGDMELYQCLEF